MSLSLSAGGGSFSFGEGGHAKREPGRAKPQENGRMRAKLAGIPSPHPALRATLSGGERDTPTT